MNEELKNIREKLHLIEDKLDEVHTLLHGMSDDTKGVLDLSDEIIALCDWKVTLKCHYNEYARMILNNH